MENFLPAYDFFLAEADSLIDFGFQFGWEFIG
jgi:hypothetical protein